MKAPIVNVISMLIGLFIISCDADKNESKTCTIFAATGTRQVSEEICNLFEQNYNCFINRNYASSGILARQIDKGAMADIYISANKQWIDYLANKNILVDSTIRIMAETRLVIIAPRNKGEITFDFTPEYNIAKTVPNRIAIGNPGHVPVGAYARDVLKNLQWLEKLENKVLLAKDVSSILHYVELGECDWGIVYYTEAIKSNKVNIIADIPTKFHDPVVFYIGKSRSAKPESHLLNAFFYSHKGMKLLTRSGFSVIQPVSDLDSQIIRSVRLNFYNERN